jgi:hypothetical protein
MSAEQLEAMNSDLVVYKDNYGNYRVLLKSVTPNLVLIIMKELVQPASESDDDVYAAITTVVERYYAQLLADHEED